MLGEQRHLTLDPCLDHIDPTNCTVELSNGLALLGQGHPWNNQIACIYGVEVAQQRPGIPGYHLLLRLP